ncbi:MAG: RrF2 family transcriptional regulator [Phycisphaerales bacterium]
MFTQTAKYALRAMCCMASRPGVTVPTAMLARHAGVPPTYLAKVLCRLAHARLIEGRRGNNGGYRLARAARDIRLADVVRAVEGPSRPRRGPTAEEGAEGALHPLRALLEEVADATVARLDVVTLADLVPSGAPPDGLAGKSLSIETIRAAAARLGR